MDRYMTVNGKKSCGYAVLKPYPDREIFAFKMYGKLYWCGDCEQMRDRKKDAFIDAGVPNDYFLQAEMRQFLKGKGAGK